MPSNTTSNFFTVDVEEYFQVRALESAVSREEWTWRPSRVSASIDRLLEVLERHNARGTFFVLGWIARHRPEVVRAIATAGHEIASHGFWHERVTVHDPDSFREDARASKQELQDVVGREILGYRAPNFSIVPGLEWAFDVLLEEGYTYDSSLFPIRRRGYGYPNARSFPHVIQRPSGGLAEFPLATTSLFGYRIPAAGGGYLRHFPLAIIRRAFKEANDRGEPSTFYIHPWEIDPEQPRLPVSALNRVRHYRGLDGTLARINQLLAEFSFSTIASYLPHLEAQPPTSLTSGAA